MEDSSKGKRRLKPNNMVYKRGLFVLESFEIDILAHRRSICDQVALAA